MKFLEKKLMEVTTTSNGIYITELSPFYLIAHIDELAEKAKTGLAIYQDLQNLTSVDDINAIIDIIRMSSSVIDAKKQLISELNIHEQTAQYLLDEELSELTMMPSYDYEWQIEFFKNASSQLELLANQQKIWEQKNVEIE